jgi:hypothetical protein
LVEQKDKFCLSSKDECERNLEVLTNAGQSAQKMTYHTHADITVASYRSRWDAVHLTVQVYKYDAVHLIAQVFKYDAVHFTVRVYKYDAVLHCTGIKIRVCTSHRTSVQCIYDVVHLTEREYKDNTGTVYLIVQVYKYNAIYLFVLYCTSRRTGKQMLCFTSHSTGTQIRTFCHRTREVKSLLSLFYKLFLDVNTYTAIFQS